MALITGWLAGVFIINAVLGALLVLGVFTVMERQYAVGAVSGIGVGSVVIYAEATMGEQLFAPTVNEMKLLVLAASLGAVIGVTATVFAVEPELEAR